MVKRITPVVPAPGALSGVEDPAARRALQALQEGWMTRNGKTDARFLTKADLKDMATELLGEGLRQSLAGGGKRGGLSGGANDGLPPGFDSVEELIASLEALIRKTPLWNHLGREVSWLSEQNNLSVERIKGLGEGFITERIERIEGESKLLGDMTAIKVEVEQNQAAIMKEQEVRADSDSAMAQAINTMWAAAGTNNALIQNGDHIEVNWNAAEANRWNQLQTEVFGANGQSIRQALAEESLLRSNADGNLYAQYSVKIDQNGYVSGFGLSSESNHGRPESAFFIRADRFAIGNPSVAKPGSALSPPTENMPFIVSNGEVHINSAVIGNATITTGHIKNLAVDTLKIANNAVTITRNYSTKQHIINDGTQHLKLHTILTADMSYKYLPQGVLVFVNIVLGNPGAYDESYLWALQCELRCNGFMIGKREATVPTKFGRYSLVFVFYQNDPSVGNMKYEVLVSGERPVPLHIHEANITLFGAMR